MRVFRKLSRGQKLVLGIVAVVALAGGGAALAAWLATGTGSGAAQATNAEGLVVEVASTTGQLYPGGTGDIKVKVTNPNDYPVQVTDISSTGTIDSSGPAACDASTGVSYVDSATTDDLPFTIAANGNQTVTLDGAASMTNASDTTCQGATFTIPITVDGASAAS